MAVIDLSAVNNYPFTKRVALSATPNTMQQITIGSRCTQVQIIFETNSGLVMTNGGTDNTVITSEDGYLTVPANSLYYHDLARAKTQHNIWVASGTGSTVVSVQLGERD
tara:strand:- start:220 stop:546 length:327 start_codon:yes stop_codon:yes gene_type:complete